MARAAAAHTRVSILTNSPYAELVKSAMRPLDIRALDPSITVNEGRTAVLRWLAEAKADVLVVDTFPRGLGGELPDALAGFSGLKVLVQRDLNPDYAAKYQLNAFIAKNYDLVLTTGDGNSGAPWLIRSQHELPERETARHLLGVSGERPCVAICASGNSEELAWYGAVASHLFKSCVVRCIAPVRPPNCPVECWISYFPAMDLYPGADILIGGGGYNTVYEAAACDVPLICRPWPRLYDRQELRALGRAARIVTDPIQAAQAALDLATAVGRKRLISFQNGAEQAVVSVFDHSRRRF